MPLIIENRDILSQPADALILPVSCRPELTPYLDVGTASERLTFRRSLEAHRGMPINGLPAVCIVPTALLPFRYLIHVYVPPYQTAGSDDEEPDARNREALVQCYHLALHCAAENHLSTVSIPILGIAGENYPLWDAGAVALGCIRSFLTSQNSSMEISLVLSPTGLARGLICFPQYMVEPVAVFRAMGELRAAGLMLPEQLNEKLDNMEREMEQLLAERRAAMSEQAQPEEEVLSMDIVLDYLEDYLDTHSLTGLADGIGCSKGTISKIRKGRHEKIGKELAEKLGLEMGLDLTDFRRFMKAAGYNFPHDDRDLLIELYLEQGYRGLDAVRSQIYRYNPKLDFPEK